MAMGKAVWPVISVTPRICPARRNQSLILLEMFAALTLSLVQILD